MDLAIWAQAYFTEFYICLLVLLFTTTIINYQDKKRKPIPVAARVGDFGFESPQGHGRRSVVSVVCCQIEVSATSWSLVQRSPTDCGASLCVN